MRKKFGSKTDEVARKLTKIYNKRLIKSRRMSWERNVARTGERRGAYMVLVGRLERKKSFRKPRRKWEYSIKMDVQELGWGHGLVLCGSI